MTTHHQIILNAGWGLGNAAGYAKGEFTGRDEVYGKVAKIYTPPDGEPVQRASCDWEKWLLPSEPGKPQVTKYGLSFDLNDDRSWVAIENAGTRMGWEQGCADGFAKGEAAGFAEAKAKMAEIFLCIARRRYREFSKEWEQRVHSATLKQLEEWLDTLLGVPKLHSVFGESKEG